MQDLIHIQQQSIDGEPVQTVNARDLHAFLGVGKMFAHWIQERIAKFNFIENQDFIILAEIGKNSDGRGQPKKEYHLTLDMAKELAMIERTPKGKEARQYFIACERRLHAIVKTPQPHTVERLRQPHLLHGFPKGTTMTRLIREERQLVGQGVHDFGLTPEAARERAVTLMADRYGDNPAFLFRGLPVIVPERKRHNIRSKAKAAQNQLPTVPAAMDALSVDRTPATGNLVDGKMVEPVFRSAQELAGLIPVVYATGQPDGHSVNEALITLGYAQRRSDNAAFPRQPLADGLFRMEQVTTQDGRKVSGRFITVWATDRLLPILRRHFEGKPKQLQLVTQ